MRLPAFITEALRLKVWKTMNSRPADVNIGGDEEGYPYLKRWWAIRRNPLFNIYLHLYFHDDDRILHSHPWWSVSIMASGCLREFYTKSADGANKPELHKCRIVRRGDIVLRSADMYHRLEVADSRTITIFITGPTLKTWYFACKKGLMHWKAFGAKAGLQGCGEDDHYPDSRV